MLTEEIGLSLKQTLGPMVDVREFELLSTSEFEERDVKPPEWYDETADRYLVKLEILTPPEKHILKLLSDICHHTRSQVYVAEENDNTLVIYLCPTENTFETLYEFLSSPEPSRLTQ